MTSEKGSLIVVAPYWDFWESTIGPDVRRERADQARHFGRVLGDEYEVVYAGQVTDAESAAAVGRRLGEGQVIDAILVLSSMAVPPRTSTALLEQFPHTP